MLLLAGLILAVPFGEVPPPSLPDDLPELFEEFARAVDDVFWVANVQTLHASYVSPAFERIWGRPYSSVNTPEKFLATVHPDDREMLLETFRSGQQEVEYRIFRPSGELRRVRGRKYFVPTSPSQAQRVVGIVTDVTDQRAAERSRERLAAIIENTTDIVSWATPDGVIRYLNKAGLALEEACGSKGQSLGSVLARCHPPDVLETLQTVALPTAARLGAWTGETALTTPDGRRIPVSQVILAHKGANNEIEFFSTIVRDMSQQRETEERLRQSETQLRAILAALPDLVFVTDANDCFREVHSSRPEVLIAPHETLMGRSIAEVIPQPLANRLMQATQQARESRQVVGVDYSATTPAGTLWFDARLVPLGEQGSILSVIRDITDRKRAADTLARQTQELARSNAELERFATVASHDLQEPLRMVSSYLELLAERQARAGQSDPRADEFIRTAQDGATRMRRLIVDLLTYSRVQTRPNSALPVNLNAVLAGVVQNLEPTLQKRNGQITVETMPTIFGDPTQLMQLFQNLVSNAVKFCEQPPRVTVRAKLCGNNWEFVIQDNGIGIPEADRERIFDVFTRLHHPTRYGGSGVGLAICQRVAERHSGRIWVEPAAGGGSCFHVLLPSKLV
jgi:PAS domain S-box-containing protein